MKPYDIRVVDDSELLIVWEDGHKSLYPFPYLRFNCPCAGCVDELTGRRRIKPEQISPDLLCHQIVKVGNYALKLHWPDGHSTGIYSYALFRQLCPCASCMSAFQSIPRS